MNDDDDNELILNFDTELDYNIPCFISYTPPISNPLTSKEGYVVDGFIDVFAVRPD